MELLKRGTDGLFDIIKNEAADIVISKMEGWGSTLSDLHKETLRHVAGELVFAVCADLPDSFRQRRQAIPLPVGAGKTQLFTAVLQALDKHGIGYTALVCTSSLEEMAACYHQLIEESEQAGSIACLHSADPKTIKEYNLPRSTTTPTMMRILFVSHMRVENAETMELELNIFNGKARDLVIWDESMSKTAAIHLQLDALVKVLEPMRHQARRKKGVKGQNCRAIVDTLGGVYASLEQAADDGEPKTFEPYRLILDGNRKAFKAAVKSVANRQERAVINNYIKLLESGFRLLISESGDAALGYAMVIPNELNNCFIFDASSTISQLTALDSRIQLMDGIDYENVKRFTDCKLVQYKLNASKASLNSKARLRSHMIPVRDKVLDLLAEIPRDEAVLICTAKRRKGGHDDHAGFTAALEESLYKSNKQWDVETVGVDGERLARINMITWGRHRATSAYRHCKHIIAVGVLRRRTDELRAAAMGQLEDLEDPRLDAQGFTAYVQRCEAFTAVQQLMGRGTARVIDNGEAMPSVLHLIDVDDYTTVTNPSTGESEDLVKQALPYIVYQAEKTPTDHAADELVTVLDNVGIGTGKLSVIKWSQSSPLLKQLRTKDQQTKAKTDALEAVSGAWLKEGRTLVRKKHLIM